MKGIQGKQKKYTYPLLYTYPYPYIYPSILMGIYINICLFVYYYRKCL